MFLQFRIGPLTVVNNGLYLLVVFFELVIVHQLLEHVLLPPFLLPLPFLDIDWRLVESLYFVGYLVQGDLKLGYLSFSLNLLFLFFSTWLYEPSFCAWSICLLCWKRRSELLAWIFLLLFNKYRTYQLFFFENTLLCHCSHVFNKEFQCLWVIF